MADLTGSSLADYVYYSKIPNVYRVYDDRYAGKALYEYLHSLFEGGFDDLLDKSRMIPKLVDPKTCPTDFFPYLYQSFGMPYFGDVDIYYHRIFLSNIGEFIKRRGTIGGVRYLVRVLTGMECDLKYFRGVRKGNTGRFLFITLIATTLTQVNNLPTSVKVVERFLALHLPYYIRTLIVDTKIAVVRVSVTTNNQVAVACSMHYNILVRPVGKLSLNLHTGSAISADLKYSLIPSNLHKLLITAKLHKLVGVVQHYNLNH